MITKLLNWLQKVAKKDTEERLEYLGPSDELFCHAQSYFNDSYWRLLRWEPGEWTLEHITGIYITITSGDVKLTSVVTVEVAGQQRQMLLRNSNPWLSEVRKTVLLPLLKEKEKAIKTLKKKGIHVRAGGQ